MVARFRLDVAVDVVAMEGYLPDEGPGFGWPEDMAWVNPSPVIANLNLGSGASRRPRRVVEERRPFLLYPSTNV